MHDWASFFFTGSNVLPAFMVLSNEDSFALAILVYIALLLVGCYAALRDDQSPVRKAMATRRERKRKDR